jgi:NAD(P)-dependent dehydrogenase (short-subunit alcohol dehydrogenase family)
MEFTDKAVLVTGGAYGLGRATARAFAREGAHVVVADINRGRGEETVRSIRDSGASALFVETDVRKEADVARAVTRCVETFGRLDIAINNAGITHRSTPVSEQSEQLFDDLFDTNVKGVWLGMKHAIPQILKAGGGAIVNVSSGWGWTAAPGVALYVATKHAILGLTRAVALEMATQNIRVNAVCPGGINTGMVEEFQRLNPALNEETANAHPIGRISEPDEIAEAILFLASPRASFVVGSAFAVDGGYTVQ